MVVARWIPPNNPSLTFEERVAFSGLSAFLGGHEWQRFPTFLSDTEGFAEFATPSVGDHFMATNVDDIGVPSFYLYSGTAGWMAWDFEQWQYSPGCVGLTIGNGQQNALVLREGRTVRIQYRFFFGSTSSVSGAWTATYETPTTSNSLLHYDLVPRYTTFSGAVPFPTEFNEHGFAELTDNTPLTAIEASVRIESASTWRIVTKPTVVVGGSTYLSYGGVSSTNPFTWAVNDQIFADFTYVFAN